MKSVGLRVRAWREARNLTQRMLAERAGLYHTTISELERRVTTPSIQTLQKIAEVLEVDLGTLISSDPPNHSS